MDDKITSLPEDVKELLRELITDKAEVIRENLMLKRKLANFYK